jgi:hypothetical protein
VTDEATREKDRIRSAKRYAVKRQDRAWMRQRADIAKQKYRRKLLKVKKRNKNKENKEFVAALKLARGSCFDCGLVITVDNIFCFDFDHREPRLKRFALSNSKCWSKESLKEEALKCDVVCKNCHAHRTHKQRHHLNDIIRETLKAKSVDTHPRLF